MIRTEPSAGMQVAAAAEDAPCERSRTRLGRTAGTTDGAIH